MGWTVRGFTKSQAQLGDFHFHIILSRKVLLGLVGNISKRLLFSRKTNFIIELLHKGTIYTYLPEISNKIASKLQQLLVPMEFCLVCLFL